MDNLNQQIKELIVNALELEDIKPENIKDDEPIFGAAQGGAGLGLDSIDALELGVALKKKFGVKFSAENTDNKKHFASVNALAAYITMETGEGKYD